LKNTSQKMMLVEVVPPHPGLSGITVNPVVIPMSAGRQALVSLRYTAAFRDLTAASMANLNKAQQKADSGENEEGMPKGLVARNKKIAERLEKKKADASNAAAAAQADPKKKGALAPAQAAPAKKEDPKAA
jgi:hypothetical protein